MTTLTIEPADRSAPPVAVPDAEIARRLGAIGVLFERWEAAYRLAPDATEAGVLEAYAAPIARLKARFFFRSMDVVRMHPEHPNREAARARFLAEHTHDDFEVRFFVEGRGRFYLHVGTDVYVVTCEAGDLISVPGGTRHWFDMGERPHFTAIRLFTTPDGWVATFTGDPIGTRFPPLET